MFHAGLEIRILRERLKMPAKELAQRVGLSQSQISRLEKGQRRIDMKVLERIAQALNVSPSYFFRGQTAPSTEVLPPTLPETLGKIIRSERRRQHLSAEDLARKLGKPKALIEAIEEGKRELDPELADAVLKALRLPTTFFFEIQQRAIRSLEGQVDRLNMALAEAQRGVFSMGSGEEGASGGAPEATRRRGIPILNDTVRGYPENFDPTGRPVAEISDYVYFPEAPPVDSFALYVVGESMTSETPPSFREGDLVVFARGNLRSRDFGFVRVEGEAPTFRQVFFDPGGQVRLQPLNLNYAPCVYPKERILGAWRLVGHIARY